MIDLYDRLNVIREEYRRKMNVATDAAQRFAAEEDMEKVSVYSSEAERMREAFAAMNKVMRVVQDAEDAAAIDAPRAVEAEREKANAQMLEFAQRWRDDAFEAAAEIAERYGDPQIRDDILALIRARGAAQEG